MTSPRELFKNISDGKYEPGYYFFGSEDYRIVEAEKYIAHQFLPEAQVAVNYYRINGKKTRAGDLITELSNLPMLGERQVYSISSFQHYKPKEIEAILKLLSPPDPNRIVIFSSPSSKIPKKTSKFFKDISKAVEVVEFNKLTPAEVSRALVGKLSKANIRIEHDALETLVALIAGNRGAIEIETGKLINFKNEGDSVTLEDIKSLSCGYEIFNVFELAELIAMGQAPKALQMVHSLLAEGNSPVGLTAIIQLHYICLYLVKNGQKPLRGREWLTRKFAAQASRYSHLQLEDFIIDIAETDSELRRGKIKPETQLEMLVMKLIGGKN